MIILDSSVLIDQLRDNPVAIRALADEIDRSGLPSASTVSMFEVWKGLRTHERRPAQRLFAMIRWVDVDTTTAGLAGELARIYRRSHPGLDDLDYLIAATTRRLDGTLWTHNIKHFPMIADLVPPY
jgi:predicted nucleic acid-binding protein